jgi:hypothetical protein
VARDDWRIRIHFEEHAQAQDLLERFGGSLEREAGELAQELRQRRLAVSFDEDDVFVYASSAAEAVQARAVVDAVLQEEGIDVRPSAIEHWLADEERWDDEPPAETWEEEELEQGYAPWEVRFECGSHEEALELADRLEQRGYGVTRRWKYVIAGTATEEDARSLASEHHGRVQAGGETVWEVMPGNPFAVFGGLGG